MMTCAERRIPGLIQRIVTAPKLAVEYLRSEQPPAWTRRRLGALIYPDYADADQKARTLTSREIHVFPAICDQETIAAQMPDLFRASEAAAERAEQRADSHDWHQRRDCGMV